MKQFCDTCKNAREDRSMPSNICTICDKHGIGLTIREKGLLKQVGCASYDYDGKGLTDIERREG